VDVSGVLTLKYWQTS